MFRNFFKPLAPESVGDLAGLRARIADTLIRTGVILGLPIIAVVLYRSLLFGDSLALYSSLATYGVLLLAVAFKKAVPIWFRVALCLVAIGATGLSGIFSWGLFGAGFISVFFCVVLAAALYGLRTGLFVTATGTIVIALIAWGYSSGRLHYSVPVEAYAYSRTPWAIWISLFSVAGIISSLFLTWIYSSLLRTIESLRSSELDLERVNEGLRGQARELEEANQAKDRFLSIVSHELRTPLNPIKGFISLLGKDSGLSDTSKGYLESMEHASGQLLRMIDEVVEHSDSASREVQLVPRSVNLATVLAKCVERTLWESEAKGIVLEAKISKPCDREVKLDDEQLGLALDCLIGEAIRGTREGKVVFSADLKVGGEDEGSCCIEISSSVETSSRESLDGRSFNEESLGVGEHFGRARSERIIEEMGGSISYLASGDPDWLTRLEFKLALGDTPVEEQQAEDKEVGLVWLESRAPVVLVVEDDSINQKVAVAVLRSLGVEAMCVSDGSLSLEALESSAIDLVLMDMNMSVMDGVTATRQIRESGKFAALPIVGLTAHSHTQARRSCLEAGMNRFLTKPLVRDQLADAITDLLGAGSLKRKF